MAQIAKRRSEKRAAKRAMLRAQASPDGAAAEEGAAAEDTPAADGDAPADGDASPGSEAGEEEEEEEEEEDDDDPELQMDGRKGSWDFRVFLSAEPSKVIPIGILQRSIKLTSEPPTGIAANMNH